ncbi:hypothetical protein [Saccharothrix xinjiangensis]|uniref:Transposase n=1 Tax=Saccharothrix xinjiangensis TaxID=204798 RepID=A0ABV9XZ54_9PSEU
MVSSIAPKFGVTPGTLREWIRQAAAGRRHPPGRRRSGQACARIRRRGRAGASAPLTDNSLLY